MTGIVTLDCSLLPYNDAIPPDPDRKVSLQTTLAVPGVEGLFSVYLPCSFYYSVPNELSLALLTASIEIFLVDIGCLSLCYTRPFTGNYGP